MQCHNIFIIISSIIYHFIFPFSYYYSNYSDYQCLKLSKLSLGIKWSGFFGLGMFANYKFKKYSIGYSINPIKKEWGGSKHEIGFQYIFKKDEEKDKLFSVPLRN